jgi:hypothetical protein
VQKEGKSTPVNDVRPFTPVRFDHLYCYCKRCFRSLIINDYEPAGGLICIIYQGSIAEITVAQKFNWVTYPQSGRNRFRAAFCVTFFRKKNKEENSGFVVSGDIPVVSINHSASYNAGIRMFCTTYYACPKILEGDSRKNLLI